MRSAVGFADLAHLLRVLPSGFREEAAALLGFRQVGTVPDLVGVEPVPAPPMPGLPAAHDVAARRERFLRVETAIEGGPAAPAKSPALSQCLTPDDLKSEPLAPLPPSLPLAAWSMLSARLHAALHATQPGRDLDVTALIRTWTRGECLRRIPRRRRRAWTARAALWIDRSRRLTPFWDDQSMVVRQLARLCGSAAIVPRVLDANRQAALDAWCGDLIGPETLDPAVPVLVLGDLGLFGTASDRALWLRTAQRLRREGVRIAALLPVPVSRWDRELTRAWNATPWERTSTAGDRGTPAARAEALLRLVSPTGVAQPGLVRALRQLLPSADADASTEVDVWQHGDVQAADVTGLVLDPEKSKHWRVRFAAEVPAEVQTEVSRLIDHWHGRWRPELLHAETLAWIAHGIPRPPGRPDAARAFAAKLQATLCGEGGAGAELAMVRRYGRHLLAAFPDQGYDVLPALKKVWSVAFAEVVDARLPSTIAPHELVARALEAPRRWVIVQRGEVLVLVPAATGDAPANEETGSTVAAITATAPEVWVQRGDAPWATRVPLVPRVEIPVTPGERIKLRADGGEVTLAPWERPPWATSVGRDRFGLWATFEVGGVQQRLRWIPPGRFQMGSPPTEAGRQDNEGPQHWVTITQGYWLGETPVTQALWRAVMQSNPSRFVSDDRPVEQVSWTDCRRFIARLNRSLDGLVTRLPTEAEWERACRAGTTTATWVGDLTPHGHHDAPELDAIAWYSGNSGVDRDYDLSDRPEEEDQYSGTHPVGLRQPNPYGLHDMLGNVLEWCEDVAEDHHGYPYTPEPAIDPVAWSLSPNRVFRGGSWHSVARLVRAALRDANSRDHCDALLGFRLAGSQNSGPNRPAEDNIAAPKAATLNPRYTFDTFVVGPSNQLAFAASLAAAASYPPKYNPTFLWGGAGLGKTHLLHSIGHRQLANHPSARIVYLSSAQFVNNYVHAIRAGRMYEFQRNYRDGIDVLLVDDVQFLSGIEDAQDEFFHIFNALHEKHKLIALTSDRKPEEMSDIVDRLRTRFTWGLIADIEVPEFEARLAILRKKAAVEAVALPDDVALYIASSLKSDVRGLEGALIRLSASASLLEKRIDLEFAQEILREVITTTREVITVNDIINAVAGYYGLTSSDIKSERRDKSLAVPRAVAMYLSRHHTKESYLDLGQVFGGRHPNTLISAVQKIIERVKDDALLRAEIHAIESMILRRPHVI